WLAGLPDAGAGVVTLVATGEEQADLRALFGATDGWRRDAERAGALGVAAGGALVLAGAHRLAAGVAARLVATLESGRYDRADGSGRGTTPARVLATADPGWGASGAPLALLLGACGTLSLPALVERSVDIGRLAEQFLPAEGVARRLAPDALAALTARRWPGNLAELRCVVGAAAPYAAREELTAADLRAAGLTDTTSRVWARDG
ncbi:MAG TPA: hypothetical protein VGE02_06180, partial [Gemmatimonadales bacterium]